MSDLQTNQSNGVSYELQEKVLVGGDLSKLTSEERLSYLRNLCESMGLNPLSRPFEYITLNGKLTLYARKDCTEQLRKVNGINIDKTEEEIIQNSIYVVKAHAKDKSGREDVARGAVNIGGLKGDALANAIMKAETKAKRRVTLSICGLGLLDESELETIPNVKSVGEEKSDNQPKQIEDKCKHYTDLILSSSNIEDLKGNYLESYRYAKSINREDLVEIFTQYKDAKKEDLEIGESHETV